MGEEYSNKKMLRLLPVLLQFLLLFSSLFYAHRFLFTSFAPFSGTSVQDNNEISTASNKDKACSTVANNTICCDRTSIYSDICFMQGDVRTHAASSSILLFSSNTEIEERIRPYTSKWEGITINIPELSLKIVDQNPSSFHQCDVRHNVTALFFSLGGYTGNLFHAFSNGLVPLYITSQHLHRQVVFVVLKYEHWWHTKYQEILSQLSDYPLIDFSKDTRTHCFPKAITGLRFHDSLAIDPWRIKDRKTIVDFHHMLDEAYKHRIAQGIKGNKPKLVIMARSETRVIENEGDVVNLVKAIGFNVEILKPKNTMPLSRIYSVLSSCDVMMGVHGAALTHFLFMKPGSLFLQIVPIGIEGLAELCFGEPAVKMGIKYEEYRIHPIESSLYRKYGKGDPIVQDPLSVKVKGWEVTKEVYLNGQNVTLDLSHLRQHLLKAFHNVLLQKSHNIYRQSGT